MIFGFIVGLALGVYFGPTIREKAKGPIAALVKKIEELSKKEI